MVIRQKEQSCMPVLFKVLVNKGEDIIMLTGKPMNIG